jgi:uncharacterized membrane protein YfcA
MDLESIGLLLGAAIGAFIGSYLASAREEGTYAEAS